MSALQGLLVLDLTRHLPGPYCGQLLADFGARVVKVEDQRGDPVRGMGTVYRALNAGKKSLGLDLKRPEGAKLFLDLVAKADVIVDGFRPGVLDRLGVGPDRCFQRNPRIVIAHLTGYGLEGPYRERAGHDLNYQSFAGALGANREVRTPSTPVVPGVQVADMSGALSCFSGILLALLARERTGKGQRVDASMLRAAVAMQPLQLVPRARGEQALAAETLAGHVPCYRVYATKDGKGLAIGALEPKFWESFCEIVDRPSWVGRAFDGSLIPEVEELVASRTWDEWRLLENSECCLSGALAWDEVAGDPQVEALGLFLKDEGKATRLAPPVALLGTPAEPAQSASRGIGEDTDEVLREHLALDMDAIRSLRARGVVFGEARDQGK